MSFVTEDSNSLRYFTVSLFKKKKTPLQPEYYGAELFLSVNVLRKT